MQKVIFEKIPLGPSCTAQETSVTDEDSERKENLVTPDNSMELGRRDISPVEGTCELKSTNISKIEGPPKAASKTVAFKKQISHTAPAKTVSLKTVSTSIAEKASTSTSTEASKTKKPKWDKPRVVWWLLWASRVFAFSPQEKKNCRKARMRDCEIV